MATASYKCPSCGAGLMFDPALQKIKCDFCLSEFTIADLEDYNSRLTDQAEQQTDIPADAAEHLVAYHCDSCGAEVVTEATTSATFCYYCHNPVLLTGRLSGQYRPQKVIPFAIDKDKAVEIFRQWAGKRRYVPRDFTSSSQLEKITGLYLPHWMADYRADIDYAGKGVNRRVWMSGNTEYTEHQEFTIARQGSIDVDHVHEIAFKKIDKQLLDSITPYDESKAVDFSLAYLSGFFAEKYDILQPEIQPVVEERVWRYATTLVQETIGAYSSVDMEKTDVRLSAKGWHYALLPAWIMTYLYRGKVFVYAINGQTGKIHGALPVDRKRLSLTSVIMAAVIFVLLILGGLFIW